MAILETAEAGTIKLPESIMEACNMHAGDDVELLVDGSIIRIIPTVVYSEEYIETLKAELEEFHRLDAEGKIPEYRNMEELLEDLNSDAAN